MPPSTPAGRAAVVGAGILGLSAARALADDGFAVTVHEQHAVGNPLGGSMGGSRIYRSAYKKPPYVRLGRAAIEHWRRLDPELLLPLGLLQMGEDVESYARALDECGEPYRWLTPAEAEERFPEARFHTDVLATEDAGVVRADLALRLLAAGLEVREGSRVDDPRELDADIVVVCAGGWLGELFDLPVYAQIEQVSYFAGLPETRPVLVDHGGPDGFLWYGLVTPGIGFKVGQDSARPGPFDASRPDRPVDDRVLADLLDHLPGMLPGLDPRPLRTESCLYTMSPDGDFILDTVDGVVVVGGDSGHAFKFGPLLGRFAADLAQGRSLPEDCAMFRADRFATRA